MTAHPRLAALAGRFRPQLILPLAVAALPAILVLQGLPRVVDLQANPNAATALGLGELVVPVLAAALAGVLGAMLGAGPRTLLAIGAAAQLAALPALVDIAFTMAQAAFVADAAFWVALFLSHATLSAGAASYAARPWVAAGSRLNTGIRPLPATGMLLLAGVFLVWVMALAYFGSGAWQHLLSLAAAAAVLAATVTFGSGGIARTIGWGLLIITAGVAAFAVAVEVSLMVSPPADIPDLSQFDIPRGN